MSAVQSIYLDTNAIIALVEGPEITGAGLLDFIAVSKVEQVSFHISALCIAELLVGPYRNKNKALAGEYLSLSTSIAGLIIHPVNSVILDSAAVLRAAVGRLKLPDAIHSATAAVAKCQYFLTFDKDFADLQQISHPVFDGAILSPVKIIRPDPVSLSELRKVLTS